MEYSMDYGLIPADINAVEDVHVISSTQEEIDQEDLCVAT
jgi:hypothetical protein